MRRALVGVCSVAKPRPALSSRAFAAIAGRAEVSNMVCKQARPGQSAPSSVRKASSSITQQKNLMLKGSCACGKCSFTATGEMKIGFVCHCSHCRRSGGSAGLVSAGFAPEEVTFTAVANSIMNFKPEGSTIPRISCGACGTYLGEDIRHMGLITVPVALADHEVDPAYYPSAHIFYDDRVADEPDEVTKYATRLKFQEPPSPSIEAAPDLVLEGRCACTDGKGISFKATGKPLYAVKDHSEELRRATASHAISLTAFDSSTVTWEGGSVENKKMFTKEGGKHSCAYCPICNVFVGSPSEDGKTWELPIGLSEVRVNEAYEPTHHRQFDQGVAADWGVKANLPTM